MVDLGNRCFVASWLAAVSAPSTGKCVAAAGRSLLSSSSRLPDPESWARYPAAPAIAATMTTGARAALKRLRITYLRSVAAPPKLRARDHDRGNWERKSQIRAFSAISAITELPGRNDTC